MAPVAWAISSAWTALASARRRVARLSWAESLTFSEVSLMVVTSSRRASIA